jgi:hypothetical protein
MLEIVSNRASPLSMAGGTKIWDCNFQSYSPRSEAAQACSIVCPRPPTSLFADAGSYSLGYSLPGSIASLSGQAAWVAACAQLGAEQCEWSAQVRGCPAVCAAIVTQLVTRDPGALWERCHPECYIAANRKKLALLSITCILRTGEALRDLFTASGSDTFMNGALLPTVPAPPLGKAATSPASASVSRVRPARFQHEPAIERVTRPFGG